MRWVHLDDDVIVYLREHPQERVLVALTRAAAGAVDLDARVLTLAPGMELPALLDHPGLEPRRDTLRLPATDGPTGRAWRLPATGYAPLA